MHSQEYTETVQKERIVGFRSPKPRKDGSARVSGVCPPTNVSRLPHLKGILRPGLWNKKADQTQSTLHDPNDKKEVMRNGSEHDVSCPFGCAKCTDSRFDRIIT